MKNSRLVCKPVGKKCANEQVALAENTISCIQSKFYERHAVWKFFFFIFFNMLFNQFTQLEMSRSPPFLGINKYLTHQLIQRFSRVSVIASFYRIFFLLTRYRIQNDWYDMLGGISFMNEFVSNIFYKFSPSMRDVAVVKFQLFRMFVNRVKLITVWSDMPDKHWNSPICK